MNSSYNHRKIPSIKEAKLPPKSAKMIVKVGPDVGFGSVGPGAQPRSNGLLGSVIIFCSVLLTEARRAKEKKITSSGVEIGRDDFAYWGKESLRFINK